MGYRDRQCTPLLPSHVHLTPSVWDQQGEDDKNRLQMDCHRTQADTSTPRNESVTNAIRKIKAGKQRTGDKNQKQFWVRAASSTPAPRYFMFCPKEELSF